MNVVLIIIGALLVLYSKIITVYDSTPKAMAGSIVKIVARLTGFLLLIIGIASVFGEYYGIS